MMPHHLLFSGFLNSHKEKIFLSLTSPLFLYFSIQEEIFKHSLSYKKSPPPPPEREKKKLQKTPWVDEIKKKKERTETEKGGMGAGEERNSNTHFQCLCSHWQAP